MKKDGFTVFDFSDYKAYLRQISGGAGTRRGIKTQMAATLRCQPTYISQVIHREAHLSLEQADQLSRFLDQSEEEHRYFLLLVQKDRSGTKALEAFFQKQLDEMKVQRLVLTKRLQLKSKLSLEEQALYYSSWHYAAVHIGVTVPALQTKEALGKYLGLSNRRMTEVLNFLLKAGLCTFDQKKYSVGQTHISLSSDSPLLAKHHANWRQKAIVSLDRDGVEEDLHYSAVISLARKDFLVLKEGILELLKNQREVIRSSDEEEIYCYNIDLFGISD